MRAPWIVVSVLSVVLSACARNPTPAAPGSIERQDARQLVLVLTDDWGATTGILTSFDHVEGVWRATGVSTPVTVGRNGAAWGRGLHPPQAGPQKREGDGRAPAGVFEVGSAFGYVAEQSTAMPYAAMTASHYCIDVVDSPLYNRIVDATQVGAAAIEGSTEPMRLDLHADGDQRYKIGFVIRHNPDNRPGAGSCIFAHLWKTADQSTAGCTAMEEAAMTTLLEWLDPTQRPLFVLLPHAEYLRLRAAWQLPSIEAESL